MKPLFELPKLLSLSGHEVFEWSDDDDLLDVGAGCSTGCQSGCASGCGGGTGSGC